MRKRLIYITFFILNVFLVSNLKAQFQTSVSNTLRYGSGKQQLGDINRTLVYREDLMDIKFRLPYNFNAGVRLLYDAPPEVGKTFKGLSRRFIEYSNNDLYLRAGNFSELYGKGLAINLFENRGLAYDTWADGIKAGYKIGNFVTSLLYGNIEFNDIVISRPNEEYTLTGGNFAYDFNHYFSLGISYVNAKGKIPLEGIEYNLTAQIPEIYFSLDVEKFKWNVDWSYKKTDVNNYGSSIGRALYSSLSYSTEGLGIVLDYKNYLFDERDPIERYDYTRPTRMLPFQNPPIVQKEHSYILLSRSIHEIDFNDEVGFQLEVFYSPADETYINFNASLASRHDFYQFNSPVFSFKKEDRSANFLPSTEDKYSPFWEYLLEVEQSFGFDTMLNLGIARRENVLYNDYTGSAGSHIIQSTVIPFLAEHTFNEDYSSSLQYEFESVSDNFNSSQPEYTNHYLSVVGSFFSQFNLNLRYEYTTNEFDVSGKQNWLTVEAGYRIGYSHNISLSYGSERGGQTCTNGVCRYILPFEGFKMTFLSKI